MGQMRGTSFMFSMVVLMIQLNYAAAPKESSLRGIVRSGCLRYQTHFKKRDKGVSLYFIITGQF
jgi:hypothetical protein